MPRFGLSIAVALVLGVAVSACGSSSSGSQDVAQIKQTLTRAFHALAAGDGATVCSLATTAGQKTLAQALPHSSCPAVIKIVAAHFSATVKAALGSVEVNKVSVHGNQATVANADITSTKGSLKGFIQPNSAPTKLTKGSDGTWKLSG